MATEGTGTTITFGTSGSQGDVVSIDGPSVSRESLENTHLGTTTAKTFQAATLYDAGEVSVTLRHDPDNDFIISSDAETITIELPKASTGSTTGAKYVFSGFATSDGIGGIEVDNLIERTITIKVTGAITHSVES